MLKLVCFLLLAASVSTGTVKYTDCGHAEITKLESNECEGGICTLHRGKEFKLNAEFVANQDTNKIEASITGGMNGMGGPIPDVNTDGCTYVKCPLVKGQKYIFDYSFKVPKLLPNMTNIDFGAKLTGVNGTLACLALKGSVLD